MSLSPSEKRSVLNCVPYFSLEPIVLDIGSNKGEFAELLIDNVSQIHLFEPNQLLLDYTKVKFCDRSNVVYSNLAAFIYNDQELDFYYFTNENNGLSSVYYNPKWKDLPMQKGKVKSVTIDTYCQKNDIKEVDFIKIDVEGAEADVIFGCSDLMCNKKIKYIQIEYSPHYKLNDRKFVNIIDFANRWGYKVFSTDVEGLEMTKENFVEDYRLENFIIKNMDITEDWNGEFKKNTEGMKFDFALEIGAFEGLTSCYICDTLLNEGGRMICIDPLKDQYLTTDLRDEDRLMNKELNSMFKGQHGRFKRNTKGKPIELFEMTSREAFPEIENYRFDFIYIDGDHRKEEVYNDGRQSFKLLKIGGKMLFDDYEWRPETTDGINQFLNKFAIKYKMLVKGYQVLIQKTSE